MLTIFEFQVMVAKDGVTKEATVDMEVMTKVVMEVIVRSYSY